MDMSEQAKRFHQLADEHLLRGEAELLAEIAEFLFASGVEYDDAPGMFRRWASLIDMAKKERVTKF